MQRLAECSPAIGHARSNHVRENARDLLRAQPCRVGRGAIVVLLNRYVRTRPAPMIVGRPASSSARISRRDGNIRRRRCGAMRRAIRCTVA